MIERRIITSVATHAPRQNIFRNGGARKAGGVRSQEEHGNPERPSRYKPVSSESASRGASAGQEAVLPQNVPLLSNAIQAACGLSAIIADQQGSSCTHAWLFRALADTCRSLP